MKKFILFTAIAIFALACRKESQPTKKLSILTQEVLQATARTDINDAYLLLSNSEKEDLWSTKLNAILTNDGPSFSICQYNTVTQILNMLNTYGMDTLMAHPEIGEAFLDSNLSAFETCFSPEELFLLIEFPYYSDDFSIFDAASYFATIDDDWETEYPGTGDCKCRYNIGCGFGHECQWDRHCYRTRSGCGLFGTSSCRGLCEWMPPAW